MNKQHKNMAVLTGSILSLVVITVLIVVAFKVASTTKAQELASTIGVNCGQNSSGGTVEISYINCGSAYNGIQKMESGLTDLTSYVPVIVVIIVLVVILGFLGIKRMLG